MQTVGQMIWYWGSSLFLAFLLFFPVSKWLWVSRVRALERQLQRTSTDEERMKQKRTANIIAAVIVVTFSFLFNRIMFFS